MTRRIPRRRLVVAICLPLVAWSAGHASAASEVSVAPAVTGAPEPITWSVEPSGEDGPDGRISLRHTLDPGEVVADRVTVTNYSSRAAVFRIYASDGTVASGGTFDLLPPDVEPVAGGSWIGVGPVDDATEHASGGLVLEIPADSAAAVPVEIAVPSGATPGDHPAGIVAELVSVGGEAAQLTSRVGVRVHLRVTGDLVAALEPEVVSATWVPSWNPFAPGIVRVRYAIANDGNVRVASSAEAAVAGPFGLGAAAASSEQREILPGEAAHVEVELATWPFVRSGGHLTVTPAVVGDDVVSAPLQAVTVRFGIWTLPWSQLTFVLLVTGGVYLLRWYRGRTAARTERRIAEAVAAATARSPAPDDAA